MIWCCQNNKVSQITLSFTILWQNAWLLSVWELVSRDYKHGNAISSWLPLINTLRPKQNGRHFPDDILKYHFLNENVWFLFKISLKCVPKVPINKIPALVQIMAWRRPGDKSWSETMMVTLLTHICATRLQWFWENQAASLFSKLLWCHSSHYSGVQTLTYLQHATHHNNQLVQVLLFFCCGSVPIDGDLATLQWHDDVIKWKHFPCYRPFVRGIRRSSVNSSHKGQWRGVSIISLICAWINRWVNNREAGDLRHHRAHYDVIVMETTMMKISRWTTLITDNATTSKQKES